MDQPPAYDNGPKGPTYQPTAPYPTGPGQSAPYYPQAGGIQPGVAYTAPPPGVAYYQNTPQGYGPPPQTIIRTAGPPYQGQPNTV